MALIATLALAIPAPAVLAEVATQTVSMPSKATPRTILVMLRRARDHYRPNGSYAASYGSALSRSAVRNLAATIARRARLEVVESWAMPVLDLECVLMTVPLDVTLVDAIARVSKDPNVEWSEEVHSYELQDASRKYDDPLADAQPVVVEWRLADLQRIATGRGVRIAIVDSGVERNHPDLRGRIAIDQNFVSGSGFVAETHGTEVAGIIAARPNNGIGIAGIAPEAIVMSLRACRGTPGRTVTLCDTLSLAKALQFAIEEKAHVINLSLAGPSDRLLRSLIDLATARGANVVAAYDDRRVDGGFPASMANVVAVARAPSPRMAGRTLVAPGRGIPTTTTGGGWGVVTGSSFAAAHVTGLLALARQRSAAGGKPFQFRAERMAGGALNACATLLGGRGSCVPEAVNAGAKR